MNSKAILGVVGGGVLLLALLMGLMGGGQGAVMAAPQAAPTPVSVTRPVSSQPQLSAIANAQVIAADTRLGCVASSNHSLMDLQYGIDQGTVNTVTLKLQFTNDTPGASATYIDGVNVVATNAADASDMQPFQLFGAWTCIYADVANTNNLTVTVKGLLK